MASIVGTRNRKPAISDPKTNVSYGLLIQLTIGRNSGVITRGFIGPLHQLQSAIIDAHGHSMFAIDYVDLAAVIIADRAGTQILHTYNGIVLYEGMLNDVLCIVSYRWSLHSLNLVKPEMDGIKTAWIENRFYCGYFKPVLQYWSFEPDTSIDILFAIDANNNLVPLRTARETSAFIQSHREFIPQWCLN